MKAVSIRRIYRFLVKIPGSAPAVTYLNRKFRNRKTLDLEPIIPTKVLIYATPFMNLTDEQPLLVILDVFLEQQEKYLSNSRRIIILIPDQNVSTTTIKQIIDDFSPIISHIVVGNLFEIDRFLRTFLSEIAIMKVLMR